MKNLLPLELHTMSLNEGVMSEIHIMAKEARNVKEFIKEFLSEYGDKVKDSPETRKWLESMYDDTVNEKSKGLWANIHAKRKRGEKPARKGSEAYKKAKKAADEINDESEQVDEAAISLPGFVLLAIGAGLAARIGFMSDEKLQRGIDVTKATAKSIVRELPIIGNKIKKKEFNQSQADDIQKYLKDELSDQDIVDILMKNPDIQQSIINLANGGGTYRYYYDTIKKLGGAQEYGRAHKKFKALRKKIADGEIEVKESVNEGLNKSELTYQLSIDYSGNSKPKITKLNKKEIHVKYGYKISHEEVIKSINKIYPDIEFSHIGWSNNGSGGGVHKFKINESLELDISNAEGKELESISNSIQNFKLLSRNEQDQFLKNYTAILPSNVVDILKSYRVDENSGLNESERPRFKKRDRIEYRLTHQGGVGQYANAISKSDNIETGVIAKRTRSLAGFKYMLTTGLELSDHEILGLAESVTEASRWKGKEIYPDYVKPSDIGGFVKKESDLEVGKTYVFFEPGMNAWQAEWTYNGSVGKGAAFGHKFTSNAQFVDHKEEYFSKEDIEDMIKTKELAVMESESVTESSKYKKEADAILQDLKDERGGIGELHGMSMEDALDTVDTYGWKDSKKEKIAQELVALCNESVTEKTSVKKGDYVLYKGNGTKWVKSEVMQVIPSANKLHIDWNDEYTEVHVKEIKPVKESVTESKNTKELTKIFRKEFEEFPFDYKEEGSRIIIDPNGYNPDGTLFSMKDDWREDIMRVVQKNKKKWHIVPNNGGGLTIHVKESHVMTLESFVGEARAYKLKASEFGQNTMSAPYAVKGENGTWRVHSTYAIDQVSGNDNKEERDVVFFEVFPYSNNIVIKIGGIHNIGKTNASTYGTNFATTVEEFKEDPSGIAKQASDFLTDANHLKWLNKNAKSEGQKIKWALKDDYSPVIRDLVNKALGVNESVNEYGPMRGSVNRNYSTNELVDRIGDLDDILMNDRKTEREWEEMSQNYLDGERGSEYWQDLGDQELQDAIDDAEYLMKKYRIKESVNEAKTYRLYMNSDADEPNEISYEEYFESGTKAEMIKKAKKYAKDKTNQYGDPIKIAIASEDDIDDVVWTNESVNETASPYELSAEAFTAELEKANFISPNIEVSVGPSRWGKPGELRYRDHVTLRTVGNPMELYVIPLGGDNDYELYTDKSYRTGRELKRGDAKTIIRAMKRYVNQMNESVNEAEKYDLNFKIGDTVDLLDDTWEIIGDMKPNKKFKNPFTFQGEDMKQVPVYPPSTNKYAEGYKVRTVETKGYTPQYGFLYQYTGGGKLYTKLAIAGVPQNESVVNEGKDKVDVASLSIGNTYKDKKGYPVKVIDIKGTGSRWKITYQYEDGKEKTVSTSLDKGINLYESLDEGRDDVVFTIDDGNLDNKFLMTRSLSRNLDYQHDSGDQYYVLPKRDFDRLEDYADSHGYDSESIYVIEESLNEKKQLPKEISKHKDIPSWAKYVAQQSDGEWTWYEDTPTMIKFRSGGGAWKQDGNQTYTGVKTDGKDWDKMPTYYYVKGGKITESVNEETHKTYAIEDSILQGIAEYLETTKGKLFKVINYDKRAARDLSELAKHLKPILDNWDEYGKVEEKLTQTFGDYLREHSLSEKIIYLFEALNEALPTQEIDPDKFPDQWKKDKDFFKRGYKDDTPMDDVVETKPVQIPASRLKPSQDAVYLGKALGMAIGGVEGGSLHAIISSDNRILDGHHRWAATIFNNPNARVGGVQAALKIGDLVPVLRQAGDALGNKRGLPPKGGDINIFKATLADVRNCVYSGENMNPEFYNKEGAIDWFETKGEKKIQASLNLLQKVGPPAGAPPRADMPKVEPEQVKNVTSKLAGGAIDVRKPYVGDPKVKSGKSGLSNYLNK